MYKSFDEIVITCKNSPFNRMLAVAAAADKPVIEALLQAKRDGIAEAILVGEKTQILSILNECGGIGEFKIVSAEPGTEGQRAVELVQSGTANILMKGLCDTKALLSPVVKKENGLRTGSVMSHCAFFQLPNYKKLILNTDGGMMLYPTLEDKKHIIENAVMALHALGYECPKVACLCGVEKINPKMAETLDAAELQRMSEQGELPNCVVEGPISYDVAMSTEIAHHKEYISSNCGDFDIFLVPNLVAGNLMGKCYSVTVGAPMAGVIMGAKAPIVMTSRGSSAQEKYNSIAVASLIAAGMNS